MVKKPQFILPIVLGNVIKIGVESVENPMVPPEIAFLLGFWDLKLPNNFIDENIFQIIKNKYVNLTL
jgi:hypothetical protein